MSADSRSRFASTFNRRGPVIKRSGRSPDAVSSGSRSISGSKRSVKDRLGDRPDDSSEARSHQKHKRPKGTQNSESCHRNSSNDTRITKGDLRFKLMEKKDPPNDVDLRDKLSSKATLHPSEGKKSHPPKATISITTRSMVETRDISDDERQNVEDRAYERKKQSRREPRNSGGGKIMEELGDNVGGRSTHEHRDSGRRKSRREFGDSPKSQNMRELGDNVCRQSMLKTRDISDEQKNVEDRAYERERQIRRDPRGSGGGEIMRELGDNVGGQSTHKHRDSGRGQSQREFEDSPIMQNMRELGASVCRQNMQELGDTDGRHGMGEVRDIIGRQSRQEFRDGVGWKSMGESLDSYNVEKQSIQEPSVYSGERGNMQESWDAYNSGKPSIIDTRDCHDRGRQGIPGQIPSRIGCDLPAVGHVRTSYPPWTPENLKRRSPDRMSCSSMTRTFSPERNVELQRRAFFRAYDDGSSSTYRRNEVPTPHTVAGSAIYMNQPPLNALPPMHAVPVPTLATFPLTTAQFPQSNGMRVLNPVEQPTVIGFLQSIGLEKYAINFQHEEVDFHTLRQMTDSDLKELHIPMGPRKKILQAMLPPPRR